MINVEFFGAAHAGARHLAESSGGGYAPDGELHQPHSERKTLRQPGSSGRTGEGFPRCGPSLLPEDREVTASSSPARKGRNLKKGESKDEQRKKHHPAGAVRPGAGDHRERHPPLLQAPEQAGAFPKT